MLLLKKFVSFFTCLTNFWFMILLMDFSEHTMQVVQGHLPFKELVSRLDIKFAEVPYSSVLFDHII